MSKSKRSHPWNLSCQFEAFNKHLLNIWSSGYQLLDEKEIRKGLYLSFFKNYDTYASDGIFLLVDGNCKTVSIFHESKKFNNISGRAKYLGAGKFNEVYLLQRGKKQGNILMIISSSTNSIKLGIESID